MQVTVASGGAIIVGLFLVQVRHTTAGVGQAILVEILDIPAVFIAHPVDEGHTCTNIVTTMSLP